MPEFEDYERQFLLERYKADRAHELEVEKFSSQFETAFIQSSALLNGAFAAGFLAFYGGTIDKLITSKKLVITSFGCWLVGLFLAILAGHVTYYGQQTIAVVMRGESSHWARNTRIFSAPLTSGPFPSSLRWLGVRNSRAR